MSWLRYNYKCRYRVNSVICSSFIITLSIVCSFSVVSLLNYYSSSDSLSYKISKLLSLSINEIMIFSWFLICLICSFVANHSLLSFFFSFFRAYSSERSEGDSSVKWDLSIAWWVSLIQLKDSDQIRVFTLNWCLYDTNNIIMFCLSLNRSVTYSLNQVIIFLNFEWVWQLNI